VDEHDAPMARGKVGGASSGWEVAPRDLSIHFKFEGRDDDTAAREYKYHSQACGATRVHHPAPGEDKAAAAHAACKRNGIRFVRFSMVDEFIYRSEFSNGLTEHEYDHVFVGVLMASPYRIPRSRCVEMGRYGRALC